MSSLPQCLLMSPRQPPSVIGNLESTNTSLEISVVVACINIMKTTYDFNFDFYQAVEQLDILDKRDAYT